MGKDEERRSSVLLGLKQLPISKVTGITHRSTIISHCLWWSSFLTFWKKILSFISVYADTSGWPHRIALANMPRVQQRIWYVIWGSWSCPSSFVLCSIAQYAITRSLPRLLKKPAQGGYTSGWAYIYWAIMDVRGRIRPSWPQAAQVICGPTQYTTGNA